MWAGLAAGTAISMTLLTNGVGLVARLAAVTWSMFFWLAEAKTSAGAPPTMLVARPELGPKLKTTLVPGWADSNWVPRVVNASLSEAAANTVTVPDTAAAEDVVEEVVEVVVLLAPESPLEPHAVVASAVARTAAAARWRYGIRVMSGSPFGG